MFSRREVLRFVFGSLDPRMRGYLDENDFQVCLSIETGKAGGRGGGTREKEGARNLGDQALLKTVWDTRFHTMEMFRWLMR